MVIVGLTGGVGMGKTTVAGLFREQGISVHDADAAVHALYSPGGLAVEPLAAAFPKTVLEKGGEREIDRTALRQVLEDRQALKRLEGIVHPLVHDAQRDFLFKAHAQGESLAVLDVPLLLESGVVERVDGVVVVSAPADVQRRRVLMRPGMGEEVFEKILARQMSDAARRKRADWVIDTGRDVAHARGQMAAVIRAATALKGRALEHHWRGSAPEKAET